MQTNVSEHSLESLNIFWWEISPKRRVNITDLLSQTNPNYVLSILMKIGKNATVNVKVFYIRHNTYKKFWKLTQNVFWGTGSVLMSRFRVWIIVSTLPCWSSEIVLHFSYGNSQKSIANCLSILNDNQPTLVVINIQRENINKVTGQVKCCPAPWTRYRPTSSVCAHAALNKEVNYRLLIGWPESYEW